VKTQLQMMMMMIIIIIIIITAKDRTFIFTFSEHRPTTRLHKDTFSSPGTTTNQTCSILDEAPSHNCALPSWHEETPGRSALQTHSTITAHMESAQLQYNSVILLHHVYNTEWNLLGQTAASRSEDFPTFQKTFTFYRACLPEKFLWIL